MKIQRFGKGKRLEAITKDELLQREGINLSRLRSRDMPMGTKILVVKQIGYVPDALVEMDNPTKVRSKSFSNGLSSEHYLIFDDGSENLAVVWDEPFEITNKYDGDKMGADYVVTNNGL